MKDFKVKKKDGSIEPLDIDKIKKCIAWCCEGLNVNNIVLESKIDAVLKDGVSTDEIQKNLIHHAATLASYDSPDWAYVAGRADTMERWKETGAYDIPFLSFVNKMIDNGLYSSQFLDYTDEDIDKLGGHIDQFIDLDHSYTSVVNANHKYLADGECLQQMHMVNAMCIASVEDGNKVVKAIEIYEGLSSRKLSLATPWLSNLRSGGNISSCFIYKFDDTRESIGDNFKRIIDTSAEGGGMGVDLSRIRASGSSVNGRKGASKGMTYTIKVINDLAIYFDQGGKRAGAITVHCPVYHADIENYLEIQDENKDPRTQSFDVFMQVGLYDEFMRALENKEPWYTFCPHEVRTKLNIELDEVFGDDFSVAYGKCVKAHNDGILEVVNVFENARDIIKMIIRKQLERGTPYLPFLDTINEANPNKHEGNIPCVNLCNEQFSNVVADKLAHTCNLASIVAGRMNSFTDFLNQARTSTRILSNGIQLTNSPDKISMDHNDRYRTVGTGVMGVHDWLVKSKKSYMDLDFITKTFEYVQYGCILESIELAKERGAYPAFAGSEWDNGNMIARFKANSVSPELDWDALQADIDIHGIFNSQLTSPAPNTSTSLFMDSSAGVMPVYSAFFYDDNAVGQTPVPAMFLNESPMAYARSQAKYDQEDLACAIGAMQKMVDTGISSEYLFDRGDERFNAKTLYDLIMRCWKEKTKSIYYIRTHKADSDCASCAG